MKSPTESPTCDPFPGSWSINFQFLVDFTIEWFFISFSFWKADITLVFSLHILSLSADILYMLLWYICEKLILADRSAQAIYWSKYYQRVLSGVKRSFAFNLSFQPRLMVWTMKFVQLFTVMAQISSCDTLHIWPAVITRTHLGQDRRAPEPAPLADVDCGMWMKAQKKLVSGLLT